MNKEKELIMNLERIKKQIPEEKIKKKLEKAINEFKGKVKFKNILYCNCGQPLKLCYFRDKGRFFSSRIFYICEKCRELKNFEKLKGGIK